MRSFRHVFRGLLVLGAVFHVSPFAAAVAEMPEVAFEMGTGRLDIRVGGARVATYVWEDAEIPRPYFMHLAAPGGVQVSRNHPPKPEVDGENTDHPTYHPGAWLAFGDVGGLDVWRNEARVQHRRFSIPPAGGAGTGSFQVVNAYTSLDGNTAVCEEQCTYTVVAGAQGWFLMSASTFRPTGDGVAFGDQEEMGFGVRFATGLTVKYGDGHMVNSDGGKDEEGTWGRSAQWCSGYSATDGKCAGMMVLTDPGNFRPSWFHSRDYGLIVANPFGKKALTAPKDKNVVPDSTRLEAGESLTLGFGVYLFSVPGAKPPDFDAVYAEYLSFVAPTAPRGK